MELHATSKAHWLAQFLMDWRFPVFALALVAGVTMLSLGVLWIPPS